MGPYKTKHNASHQGATSFTVFALGSSYSHLRTQKASVLSSKSTNNQKHQETSMTSSNSWFSQLLLTILPLFSLPSLVGKNK